MYTQAHSDLNAIRPGMGMFILYGVPLIAASTAGFGLSLQFETVVGIPALMLVAAVFIVATRGVDTEEVARHQNRFLYVAASATTKALQLSIVVALLLTVMGGSMAAIRAGLLFGMIYTLAMIVLSLLATRFAIRNVRVVFA